MEFKHRSLQRDKYLKLKKMEEIKNTTWNVKLNSLKSLKGQVKSIFNMAKKHHIKHSKIIEDLNLMVYTKSKYKTLPMYMRSEISGYIDAHYDMMYEHLEFGYIYDGKFILNLTYDENFNQNLIEYSGHYYKGSQDSY